MLWVRSCAASQRRNGDHSTFSRLTDSLYRARLNDRLTRDKKAEMIGKSPLDKRLADKYENPSVGEMPPKEFQKLELSKRSEPSCIKEKKQVSLTCNGVSTSILTAVCRVSSLNACHNSVPIYFYKKCNAVMTYVAGCGSFPTDCECAD